jgi:RNA polymerase sigma factor (sigma-70 family)
MDAEREARFAAWMREHLAVLKRVSRAFATGADQHDLLQEIMLAVWRAAPAFRGEAKPSTFIFRVAHNAALTWRRREGTRRRRQADYERLEVDDSSVGEEEALLARLYDAIHQLEALDRSLVLLSFEGLSYLEIGDIHGLTESNVGARLSRARTKLARLMGKSDD